MHWPWQHKAAAVADKLDAHAAAIAAKVAAIKGSSPAPAIPHFLAAPAPAQEPAPSPAPEPIVRASEPDPEPLAAAASPVAPAQSLTAKEDTHMSILTQLAKKQITFAQAAAEFEAWEKQIVAGNPALATAAAQSTVILKQTASNIVAFAGTELEPLLTAAIPTIENALEGLLAAATKGASVGANPLITAGLDQLGALLKGLVDTAITNTKASLATPAAA